MPSGAKKRAKQKQALAQTAKLNGATVTEAAPVAEKPQLSSDASKAEPPVLSRIAEGTPTAKAQHSQKLDTSRANETVAVTKKSSSPASVLTSLPSEESQAVPSQPEAVAQEALTKDLPATKLEGKLNGAPATESPKASLDPKGPSSVPASLPIAEASVEPVVEAAPAPAALDAELSSAEKAAQSRGIQEAAVAEASSREAAAAEEPEATSCSGTFCWLFSAPFVRHSKPPAKAKPE